jgi:FkbM family methyltransferase
MMAEKKGTAVVFCLTANMAFALGCVLLDLKKHSPNLADEVVVFHDGITAQDQNVLRTLFPTRFITYDFPVKKVSPFQDFMLWHFTEMVFAKFECFRLLDEFRSVVYLDYDLVIRNDISELLSPCESGLKLLPSTMSVAEGLFYPISAFDMDAQSTLACVIVFHDNLANYRRLYDWCYEKTCEYASALKFPEQAIFDFMMQTFHITPTPLDPHIYCCHPQDTDNLGKAKIVHVWGQPKFWNGWHFPEWDETYTKWISMGGSAYVMDRESFLGKYAGKVQRRLKRYVGRLKDVKRILGLASELRNHSLLYRYFLSPQYREKSWTFAQCKNFGREFETIYFRDDFVEEFARLLRGMDGPSARRMKYIFARMLMLSFLNRDSVFTEEELEAFSREEELARSLRHNDGVHEVRGFKFKNANMTLHNFIDDLGLALVDEKERLRGKDIIDVGAYVGDSSLILCGYTERFVHAFEPFEEAYAELVQNITLNGASKIIPRKLGLSNVKGMKTLYFASGSNLSVSTMDPAKSLTKGAYHGVEIELTTIDSYVRENGLRIGVIKIDAEGSEQNVLDGARETIARDKPILLLSIYHNVDDFMHIKPWVDDLGLGYRCTVFKPEASTFIEETMLVCT